MGSITTTNNLLRLFIGIPVENDALSKYFEQQATLLKNSKLRMVPRANYHLTLLFVGNYPAARLNQVKRELKELSKEVNSFNLMFKTFCFAPLGRKPYMLWALYEECKSFELLASKLAKQLMITPDFKALPHITLARFKQQNFNVEKINFAQASLAPFLVSQFALYQSTLGTGGAKYEILERFSLAGDL